MDVAQLDTWIREGRGVLARRSLEDYFREHGYAGLAREARLEVARLARRAGIPLAGVKVLHALVRPPVRSSAAATAAERAEYAASLAQIGAEGEALGILAQIDAAANPESLLFAAFAHFARWDYPAALPLLERYEKGLDGYPRLVAQINLAAALVATDELARAIPLLDALAAEASKGGHELLAGNAYLLKAEALVENGSLREAARLLDAASERSRQVASLDSLFIEKWRAILRLKEGARGATRAMDRVRERANQARAGETLRDLDFHQAVALDDDRLFARAYWGTPYPQYRRRLEAFPLKARLPKRPSWVHGSSTRPLDIDLFHGTLKPGQVLWRLAGCLVSDAYRSFRLAAVHAAIFPERHFHPLHSPNLVHQAVRRLRAEIPFALVEEKGSYRFEYHRSVRVFLPAEGGATRLKLEQFRARHAGAFRRRDLEKALGISERAAAYLLAEALRQGWVSTEGNGKSRKYR